MENFKLVARLDTLPLLNAVKRRPYLWDENTIRQSVDGSPHRDTKSIYLRGPSEFTHEKVFNETVAINYKAMDELPEAHSLIHAVADVVNAAEIGRIMIVSLPPNGFITPHRDEGKYANYYERFHVVLASNPDCWFHCSHNKDQIESVRMKAVEAWWFHHKREHSFLNSGTTDRIHLIMDMVAPAYRREYD